MARFFTMKKRDDEDERTADPFGVLNTRTRKAEKNETNIHEMAKAYEFLADGFEDIEALAPVDILRRAGVEVTTVSIGSTTAVTSAHGVTVEADTTFGQASLDDADLLLIPGGMPGAKNIDEHEGVRQAVVRQAKAGRLVGAICAGPMVLGHLGLLRGRRATCYPGFEDQLEGAEYTAAQATIDGNIITGKGPGATLNYAFLIAEVMKGSRVAEALKESMMYED